MVISGAYNYDIVDYMIGKNISLRINDNYFISFPFVKGINNVVKLQFQKIHW